MSRKILFVTGTGKFIGNANVWFFGTFPFSREANESKQARGMGSSFKEVTPRKSKDFCQKYLRYLFGITDLSRSVPSESSCWNCVHSWYISMEKKSQSMKWKSREEQRDIWNPFRDRIPVKRQQMKNLYDFCSFTTFLVVKGYLKKIAPSGMSIICRKKCMATMTAAYQKESIRKFYRSWQSFRNICG